MNWVFDPALALSTALLVLMIIAALAHTGDRAKKQKMTRLLGGAAAALAFGAALVLIVPYTPIFGDPNSPANLGVGMEYVQQTPVEIGIPNVVTAVLASYRGLDTFGEVVVIFAAGVAVAAILPRRRHKVPAEGEQ